jgi:FMN phosphatase YigB (HAD superfamily)
MSHLNPTHRHDAWLIDLDGTLYRATPLRLLMAAELALCGWSAIGILRRFRQEHERLRHSPEPAASTPYALQIERTAAALNQATDRVEQIARDWMQQRPRKWLPRCLRRGLVERVERFRADGGRVAVVSDYPAGGKLAALGIAELVEAVVASGETPELKRLKPAPDGYLLAAQRLGVPAERCLVIGDRDDTDGAAAQAAQMDFLHVRRLHLLDTMEQPAMSRPAPALLPSSVAAERLL